MLLSDVSIAILLTTFAGLSTGIGSLLAFFTKQTNTRFLSFSLGFSTGVMLYISFMELLPFSLDILSTSLDAFGVWIGIASFFIGIGVVAIIDKLIPSFENPHEMHRIEELNQSEKVCRRTKLYHVGILMALAISIHNFPEGIVTFLTVMKDVKLGLVIAIAIAIHNIPEGIAVSVPIYYATCDRKKAFFYSFLSGLAEPIGGIIGFLLLRPFLNDSVIGIAYGFIAGIMVFISLDSLLPAAEEYGNHHLAITGLVLGMLIMAVSLILL
ncbi:MAG: zinc transporter ZupT [Caldisericia bacterium]|nr:zinc transporter ZupT [Caldisericia bacterium]MDD4614497.1 zinc transporter ZupT [Caldisericia bacterium]